MQLNFKLDTKRTQEVLRRVPSRLEVELHGALEQFAQLQLRNMALRMKTGIRTGFGQQTQNLTGMLGRSFTYVTRRTGQLGGLSTRVFSAGVKYAEIQERGGVVRAKSRKFLAIPQAAVKTPAGVPRYASPRHYPGKTFVMRDDRGRLWIVEKKGKGKTERLEFLWQLVKQVRIRGNLNWFRQWRQDANSRRAILSAATKRALASAVQP